jgi:hypothetical protein
VLPSFNKEVIMTFIAACRKYFEFKQEFKGKTGLAGFALELAELTPADRTEMASALVKELGEEVTL